MSSLIAAEGARPLTLDLLPPAEARELLARRIGMDRVAAEPGAVNEIITLCARLPLALVIVAARAASHPGFPLAAIARELRDARGSLDVFDGGDAATDVRVLFSWSYRTLSTAGARLFRLLGIHTGPDIAVSAAASLAHVPVDQARRLLAELARAHLIAEHVASRFVFHDLLRAYATELAHAVDSENERRAALHRVLDHYLHTAYSAELCLDPYWSLIKLGPAQPGVTPETFTAVEQALAWFTSEYSVLLAEIRQAAGCGFDTHAWQLAVALTDFFSRRGYYDEYLATQRIALSAARNQGDQVGQGFAHRYIALALARAGRYDDAHPHLREALALFGQLGDHRGQATAHLASGFVSWRQGRLSDALRHAERALDLCQLVGEQVLQARALNAVGWYHGLLGDYQQALTYCQRALDIMCEIGDRYGQANTWDSVGYAYHHLGRYPEAIDCYQQTLRLRRERGDRYYEAEVLIHLGDTHQASGALETARRSFQRAMDILEELGHPDADQVRAKLGQLTTLGQTFTTIP
jgi:tetratricopeptide (TPR) repeat protein